MATSINKYRKDDQDDSNALILGIDIGTTNIKASLVNKASKEPIARQDVQHCAQIESEITGGINSKSKRSEQVVGRIFSALNKCLSQLPDDTLKHVEDIAICGQMHGCVLWDKEKLFALEGVGVEDRLQQTEGCVSSLITWEDARCSPEFLRTLPSSVAPLATGFGCVTLFWLHRNTPEILEHYDSAGTIMDLVVACICRNKEVCISSQNACSWGYYDEKSQNWESDKLIQANFPVHLLPKVYEPGFVAGKLSYCWFGIPSGAIVRVALGDMQCSIYATSSHSIDAVLNIGTSAILSVIISEDLKDSMSKEMLLSHPALNLLPYFNNSWLVVAACLTGGNTLAFFVKMLQSWTSDLGLEQPSNEDIYKRLSECSNKNNDCPKLTIDPVLWGERHNPNQSATVTNISPGELSLGNVYNSLCHGVIVNMQSMMSSDFLKKCGVQRIIGTGNALVRNAALQKSVQDVFNLEFVLCKETDASVGAAVSAV